MNAWEILTANALTLGNAWQRLESIVSAGTIIRCPSSYMADKVIELDMSTPEVSLSTTVVELDLLVNPTEVTFSNSPVEYQFSVDVPIVALEV
jgi:hypothetical protein